MIARSLTHEVVDTGEVRLHVARAGAGPPVILLHGFPEHWYSWRHQIGPLVDAGFSVVAPDMRGYNLSSRPRPIRSYAISRLVADVAALVRHTGAERAHVVGHDWGGVVAWAFADRHPRMLDRLAILNAPHPGIYLERVWRPPQLFRSWYVGFFQLPWLPELAIRAGDFAALRRMFRDDPVRPGAFAPREIARYVEAASRPGALTGMINYYRATRFRKEIARVRRARTGAETLVIWGERDRALDVGLLDGIERFAPNVRIERLADVGHWVQNEAPREVNGMLVPFLKGVARG